MKTLFVCSSHKDRSPALEAYFTANHPEHQFRSAGVSGYFTDKHNTHLITQADMDWADVVVYAELIHRDVAKKTLTFKGKEIVLGLGNYTQGCIGDDYLLGAEEMIGCLFDDGK